MVTSTPVRPFPKTFVILAKKYEENLKMKPSYQELLELNESGLGEQVVQLQDEDNANVVLSKLVE